MIRFYKLSIYRTPLIRLFCIVMSQSIEKVFYAVAKGKNTGIFYTWKDCQAQTLNFRNAKFKKFYDLREAEEYIKFWEGYSSPDEEREESKNIVSKNCKQKWKKNGGIKCFHKGNKNIPCKPAGESLLYTRNKDFLLGNVNNKNHNHNENKQFSPAIGYISPFSTVGSNYLEFSDRNRKKNLNKYLPTEPNILFNGTTQTTQVCSRESKKSGNVDVPKINKNYKNGLVNVESDDPSVVFDISNVKKSKKKVLLSNDAQNNFSNCSTLVLESGENEVQRTVENESTKKIESNNKECVSDEGVAELRSEAVANLMGLKSALKVLTQQSSNEITMLKNDLKTLLKEIYTDTDTNPTINLQMHNQGDGDDRCEDSKNWIKEPVTAVQGLGMETTTIHSTSSENSSKNVELLALSLRMDSFEKRFDSCLKEVGGIVSEISNIKLELKEIKELLSSVKSSLSERTHTASTPKKSCDGKLQTTLSFSSDSPSKSPWKSSEEASKSEKFSETMTVEKARSLKRKLSSSSLSEDSKRFANDDEDYDALISRIKTEAVDYASFIVDEEDFVEVYTDGASLNNGEKIAKAGIGIWWGDCHPLNLAEPLVGPPTNNRAEIQAARVAMQLALKAGLTKLKIFTDSSYLINCATKWIYKWRKNGWTLVGGGPVKNKKELEKLFKMQSKLKIKWEKVEGHAGIKGNEMADRLANEGAARYQR